MTRGEYKKMPELLTPAVVMAKTGFSRGELRKFRVAKMLRAVVTPGGHCRYHRSVLLSVFGLEFEDELLGEKRTN